MRRQARFKKERASSRSNSAIGPDSNRMHRLRPALRATSLPLAGLSDSTHGRTLAQ